MSEEDLAQQQDELTALESIYNGSELQIKDTNKGIFTAHIEIPDESVFMTVKDVESLPNSLKHFHIKNPEGLVEYKLRHLPPILLKFEFPSDYPSSKPPSYSLSCSWLSDNELKRVDDHLMLEWGQLNDVILFTWTSFLINEVWHFLDVPQKLSDPDQFTSDIIKQICIYDFERQSHVFSLSPHHCTVCFEEFQGKFCLQFLPCGHVFCKVCMKSYFEVLINSGDVNMLACPQDGCVSMALPTQVKELVEPLLYEKYDKFLLQRTLDQMKDVFLCPRKFCQTPNLKDDESNMAQCNSCNFIFCVLCEKTWHGQHTPCRITNGKFLEIYNTYKDSNEVGRAVLYKKYGKSHVLKVVSDIETSEWLKENSKPCPACGTLLQLGYGCNKLVCSVCKNIMCWLCGKKIENSDPYKHYRPGGPCSNRLFENTVVGDFEDGDEDFEDVEFDEFEEFGGQYP